MYKTSKILLTTLSSVFFLWGPAQNANFLWGSAQNVNFNKQKQNEMKPKKVLFVVTSADHAGTPDKKTGIWLEEFSTPYYAITDKGIEVSIASPKGGQAPIDPRSALPKSDIPSVKRFYADTATQDKLSHTVKLEAVNAADYDAVF